MRLSSFVCTQLKGSKYCYVSQTIQLESFFFFVFFLHTNGQTVLLLTIQSNASHLLVYSLNVKQFYMTHR